MGVCLMVGTFSTTRNITVTLPPLHRGRLPNGGQQAIEDANKRYEVIVCGRQWGKTTYAIRKQVKCVLDRGGLYWWIAPTYKVARPGWVMLHKLAVQLQDAGVPVKIHETEKYVTFPKGEIWIKSADDPDSLRGFTLDGVVFDEPAQTKPETWTEVIQPALIVKKGWATFIGTPKGRNWVYHLWQYAATADDWGRWRRISLDNPFIDPAEIEAKRLTTSEQSFKQEYEADFGASQYLVYPEFDREVHLWRGDLPELVSYHGALDFGGNTIGSHKSAGAWAGRTARDELIICNVFEEAGPNIEERQLNWMAEQSYLVNRMERMMGRPGKNILWKADKTQMWGIGIVRAAGYQISQTKGGRDSVEEGIELVHRRLQKRVGQLRPTRSPIHTVGEPRVRLYYLPGCELVADHMERYRYEEPEEGKVSKRQPMKIDDDLDDVIRYLCEGVDYGMVGDPHELFSGQVQGMGEEKGPERFKDRMLRIRERNSIGNI